MQQFSPKDLIHRGTVRAEAFLLPANILAPDEMRRRVLAWWRPGVRFFRLEDDLVVLLPEAVGINARRAPGLPFVRYDKILSAFPLEEKDLPPFKEAGECFAFLDAGAVKIVRPPDLQPEAVENWFDVSDFKIVETETLGEAIAAPVVMKHLSEDALNVRGELKDVPAADSELGEILTKLKAMREAKNSGSPFQNSKGSSGDGAGKAAASFLTSIFGGLKNLFASADSSTGANAGYTKPGGSGDASQPAEPNPFAELYNRLRHLAVNAVIEMRMARVFGRRQAKYIHEMMEKFERGDLSEALKYAIPLEDMQALQNLMRENPVSLFVPRPRSDLSISFGRNTNGSTINLEDEWFNRLREIYRQSFERLESQGKVEEASFVLAELLKSNAEAVEFLSKHGKYRLAAQLAEARNLPKEMVVQQWFLAGEKMRAVRLAILHDCFEYAVTKLEQGNSETGAELREIWAESLAGRGNFPAAVDVIWKLETKRAKAKDWINKTIEFGGAPAARMLARKAMLCPEEFEQIKVEFDKLILQGADDRAAEKRIAFARAVFKHNINGELQTLLRPLIRKIAGDAADESPHTLTPKEFRELVAAAKDNALRTDLPPLPQTSTPVVTDRVFEINIDENDRGASFIHDACVLPDGKVVVALGEAGVKMFNRNAKEIAFFDQPAHKLIVSDYAAKTIAVARRGETFRLARLDFVERRAHHWCEAKLNAFASNYDGSTWFVGVDDEFYAIDTNAENFEALWRVADVGGAVHSVVRSLKQVKFLTLDAKGFEIWWYELPNLTLRSRNQRKWLENAGESYLHTANISEGGHSAVVMQQPSPADESAAPPRFHALIFDHEHLARRFDFPPEVARIDRPEIFSQYSAVTSYTANRAVINIYFGDGSPTAVFSLADARNVSVKFDENHLTVVDDCGRLLVYDYRNKRLKNNLRL